MKRLIKHKSTFLKLFLSVLVLILLFKSINLDYSNFKAIFNQVDVLNILIAFLLFFVLMFIKSLRWNNLLRKEGGQVEYTQSFQIYLLSYSIGIITPGRFGEFVKACYIDHYSELNLSSTFKTVIQDRLFDLVFLMVFGTLSAINIFYHDTKFILLYYVLGMFLLTILIKIVMVLLKSQSKKRVIKFLHSLLEQLFSIISWKNWIFTIAAYSVYYFIAFIIFKSLQIEITYLASISIMNILSLVLLLPISIAGFGTREAVLVYLLSLNNVAPDFALAFSVLHLIVFVLLGGGFGTLFLIKMPLRNSFKSSLNDLLEKYK